MPFPPGHKGPGRPPGCKNKIDRDVVKVLDELGCDPARGLAQIAMDTQVRMDIREKAYSSLMKYVYPAKKEIAIEQNGPMQVSFRWENSENDPPISDG